MREAIIASGGMVALVCAVLIFAELMWRRSGVPTRTEAGHNERPPLGSPPKDMRQ